MKLILEKEHKESTSGLPWYRITVDDKFISGSSDIEVITKLYEKIKANPEILKSEREILRSEEIFVSL